MSSTVPQSLKVSKSRLDVFLDNSCGRCIINYGNGRVYMKYRMLTCIIIAALVILFTNHCTKTEDVLTVDTIPPVVTVTHPHDAQTVSGTIDITADAVDNDTITQVVFVFIQWTDTYWLWLFAEEDISEPYEYKGFITTNYPDNTQIKIRVTGYDLAGNTADDEVIVIIDN